MTIEGVFWLIEAGLFAILFILMQLYTNMLYMLQDEWKPIPLNEIKDRWPLVVHREKQSAQNEKALYLGLTGREKKRLAAKKNPGQVRKQLSKASLY